MRINLRDGALVAATIALGVFLAAGRSAEAYKGHVEAAPQQRVIEVALCLDTSGSMSGLIESAKQKLWAIVNELAGAEPTPVLRVALLTFGNNGHVAENGWVRVDSPLTGDLDAISQRLFALSTDGGTEYVGRVLQAAGQLDWHPSDDALKLVVVAGNESADQDREAGFRDMCRALIARGIMVNSIYCGPATDGIAPGWMEIARLADGQFASIDQDNGTLVVATPFDTRLAELSTALNATYVPFGAGGAAGRANQEAQDANAASLNGAAAAARAETKARGLYRCAWDLVDACRRGQVKLESISADELPEHMRDMNRDQRAAYIDMLSGQRAEIQKKIAELAAGRDAYVAEQLRQRALDESKSFDAAIRRAVRGQAGRRGFRFSDPLPATPEPGPVAAKEGDC